LGRNPFFVSDEIISVPVQVFRNEKQDYLMGGRMVKFAKRKRFKYGNNKRRKSVFNL